MDAVEEAPNKETLAYEEKSPVQLSSASAEEKPSSWNHLHVARRDESVPVYDGIQNELTGFDASVMGARTLLSAEEEKKLLRRVDWHLLPLLSLMYMVKTIDAAGVRLALSSSLQGNTYVRVDFEHQNHGQGISAQHHDGASYDCGSVQSGDHFILCMANGQFSQLRS